MSLAAVAALVDLAHDPRAAVLVHADEQRRQHVEAVVQRDVPPPPRRRLKRLADVVLAVPLGEVLSHEHVPIAVAPRLAQPVGQVVQPPDVFRVLLHQDVVVRHLRGDEHIVLRTLAAAEIAVDEQPLHPRVSRPAGVAGEIHPLGKVVGAAQRRRQRRVLVLGEVRRLVEENGVVLLPLVLVHVALAVAVAEDDQAAVRELEGLVRRLVVRHAAQQPAHGADVVLPQLHQRAAQDQNADARVPRRHEDRLVLHAPALAAAPRPAIADIALPRGEKQLLLRLRRRQYDLSRHALPPCRTASG